MAKLDPPNRKTEDEAHAELHRRARAGAVRLGAPNRPDVYPRPSRRLPTRVVQDMLDGTRDDAVPVAPAPGRAPRSQS